MDFGCRIVIFSGKRVHDIDEPYQNRGDLEVKEVGEVDGILSNI